MSASPLPYPWSQSEVWVVVPTYNEASNLAELARRTLELPLPNLRLLVVDDASPDGTGDLADELATTHPGRISVVHRAGKEGLGRAYVAGMRYALDAGAEFVAQMDADLSHPPAYLPQLLGTLLATGSGLVIGSRYVPGGSLASDWGAHRRLLSGWANTYLKTVLELPIRDITAGYKMWSRTALTAVDLDAVASTGYSFQVEMHYRAYTRGQKIVEIPIHFSERHTGTSKMDLRVQLESALQPFRLRHQARPRR